MYAASVRLDLLVPTYRLLGRLRLAYLTELGTQDSAQTCWLFVLKVSFYADIGTLVEVAHPLKFPSYLITITDNLQLHPDESQLHVMEKRLSFCSLCKVLRALKTTCPISFLFQELEAGHEIKMSVTELFYLTLRRILCSMIFELETIKG